MSIHRKVFFHFKVAVSIILPIFISVMVLAFLKAVERDEISLLVASIFGVLLSCFVVALLYRVYGHLIDTIKFEDKRVVFVLNNNKNFVFLLEDIKEVIADISRIKFVCINSTGNRITLILQTNYPFYGKVFVDTNEMKTKFADAKFYGI